MYIHSRSHLVFKLFCLLAIAAFAAGQPSILVQSGRDTPGPNVSASWQAGAKPLALWTKSFGGFWNDQGNSIAMDSSGNVFVTGSSESPIYFSGGSLTFQGHVKVVLAKYSPDGDLLWSKNFGGVGLDVGNSIAVDAVGNVFVTGAFESTIDFGSGLLTSAGLADVFLAKFDTNGNALWSRRFGSTSGDYGRGVATDSSGNVFLTGDFQNSVDFGTGSLTSAGMPDIFVAKFDASGNPLWSKGFGSTLLDYGKRVATDSAGNVFATGSFSETVDFGSGALTSAGSQDIFLAKFDSSGNSLWTKRFGGPNLDEGDAVATDLSRNVYITGIFYGTADFGGGALTSAGGFDVFLAGFDATGGPLWSKRFGGLGSDYGYDVAAGLSGIALTGRFDYLADFGGGPLTSAGYADVFMAQYAYDGRHIWSIRFGSTLTDVGFGAATDSTGSVFVTGVFHGTVDFGGGPLTSAGESDTFLARYKTLDYTINLPLVMR